MTATVVHYFALDVQIKTFFSDFTLNYRQLTREEPGWGVGVRATPLVFQYLRDP